MKRSHELRHSQSYKSILLRSRSPYKCLHNLHFCYYSCWISRFFDSTDVDVHVHVTHHHVPLCDHLCHLSERRYQKIRLTYSYRVVPSVLTHWCQWKPCGLKWSSTNLSKMTTQQNGMSLKSTGLYTIN